MAADTATAVADLPRWLWVAVGLLVGLAHGSVREWAATEDPTDAYDVLLTDQRAFESALLSERHGHRVFKDVTVFPHWVRNPSDGRRRLVHLVTGAYWDGTTTLKDGAAQARWDPACFIAPVPYEPVLVPDPGGGYMRADGVAGAHRFDSVLDYLRLLNKERGVGYRYAWWWWVRRPMFGSTAVAVALIGIVWPAALNLLVFGTIARPPRERRPSLWRVRRRGVAAPKSLEAVERPVPMSVAPEPALSGEPTKAPDPPVTPAPLRQEGIVVPNEVVDERHFGAKPDDFYPTEIHVDPPHDR